MSNTDDFQKMIEKYNNELNQIRKKSKPLPEEKLQSNEYAVTVQNPAVTDVYVKLEQQSSNTEQVITKTQTQEQPQKQSETNEPVPTVISNNPPVFPFDNQFILPTIPESEAVEGETNNLTSVGYLIVTVVTANDAAPLNEATVIVSKNSSDGKQTLLYNVQTNSAGNTNKLELETVSSQESLQPGVAAPYASYNVKAVKEGYFKIDEINIPIFENRTAFQRIEMLPLPEFYEGNEELKRYQTGPNSLQ